MRASIRRAIACTSGQLLPLMLLRRFQKAGHRPIALVGGATGMIGDPSGKSEERNLLSNEQLQHNVAGIERQLRQLARFRRPRNAALLVNNFDWMRPFQLSRFPPRRRQALSRQRDARQGLGEGPPRTATAGISYTEFSYMLLQAYDFVYLQQQHGCELQIGGSDQWGNITAGIDLARRMHGVQLYGLTCPLLLKCDGTKMGKTEQGAVWLSADADQPVPVLSILDQRRRCRCRQLPAVPDRAAAREIKALDQSRDEQPHVRESQKRLAEELTRLVHGETGLAAARRATDIFFGAEIENLSDAQLGEIFADVPSATLPRRVAHWRRRRNLQSLSAGQSIQKQVRVPPARRPRRLLYQQPAAGRRR